MLYSKMCGEGRSGVGLMARDLLVRVEMNRKKESESIAIGGTDGY